MQLQSNQVPAVTGLQHRQNLKPLTPAQVRFEIDMCIGCDLCMQACPIPLSSSISIADLNRATITHELAPQIKQFTQECVMCGSCVPVCPVADHRDLLMLSLKQYLGAEWDRPLDPESVQSLLPAGWSLQMLISRLRDQPMFHRPQEVPDNYLLHLVTGSKLTKLNAHTTIFQEGEFGRSLYCLLDGQVELSTHGDDGTAIPVAVLRPGEYLGDYALLTGQPQHTTARTLNPSVLLEIPEQVMQRLQALAPAVSSYFEQLSYTRSIETILKRLSLFQGVSAIDIDTLAEDAQIKRYERGQRLFSEDNQDPSQPFQPDRETLHVIMDGFVKVARRTATGLNGERIIAYRQGGDYFAGGLDMLGDRQAVSVSAITRVRVAEIPRHALMSLFVLYPEVSQRFNERLQQYHSDIEAAQTALFAAIRPEQLGPKPFNPLSDSKARRGLHSLVEDGVVEGTEVLVIDLDKCIHCNECEEACARRHGHSRINRKGLVVDNITIATACRQCQDPVCMLCSRAGIARKPGGEVYITESCIGCGICAERCPYDTIKIVPVEESRHNSQELSTWQRFSRIFTDGLITERVGKSLPMASKAPSSPQELRELVEAQKARNRAEKQAKNGFDEMRKKIAVKCDLCAGYNNQACVQACPSGAAMRVQPAKFFGSTEDILRRRTR